MPSLMDETWSSIFRPERPNPHLAPVQMPLCILQGLEPSACDSFGASTSLVCQCLSVDGDGPKMLSAIKGFLLKSTRQFASGSEHLLGRETSSIHSSFNKHLLSAYY